MSEYIGNRIVPRHDGVWDKSKTYEPLTIVLEESTGDSYISRREVPAGTQLSQENYWAMCSRFSEQMALLRENTENDVTELRKDTASEVASLRKLTAQDVADITQKVNAANSAVAANKAEMDKATENLQARIDANIKASTSKNANYAQELVDTRVDDNGKTYNTAGDNLRAIGRVRSMQNIMKNWYLNVGYANQYGNFVSSESWRVAYMVSVTGDSILVDGEFGFMSGNEEYNNVVCYDADRKYLGGCFRAEDGKVYDNYVVSLLPNTRFISVTTSQKLISKSYVYCYDNLFPLRSVSNYATSWQWMNGSVDIRFTGSKVTVTFPENKTVYVCCRPNGTQYAQVSLKAENNVEVDFTAKGWWAIYYDGVEVTTDSENNTVKTPVIQVKGTTGGDWGKLFTQNRFVFAVFYDGLLVYAAPSSGGTVINGVDYGNPAKIGYNSMLQHRYRSAKMYEVQKFVDQAKKFIDALLDKETGFPNCKVGIGLCGPGSDYSYQCGASMGIFHMSINTLNLALIKAFDAGKYHKNVTCFAHGLRTDRRLAFPYSDKPVTDRFTETSRTLTNSIHPSARGYQAWADGYYCQIRAWLTEDSK